jgi:hypothetical protein
VIGRRANTPHRHTPLPLHLAGGGTVQLTASGGNSDKWCSSAAPRFLRVDLGAPVALSSVIARHASAGGESASFNTGVTTSPVTATARFLRVAVLTAEQGSPNGAARIYELEVYG